MKKVTLESFCRDADGELRCGTEAMWSNVPFRIGRFTAATNGHILIWRRTKPEDRVWHPIEEDRKSDYPPRGPRVSAYFGRHPGADACRKPWPTNAPEPMVGKSDGLWNPQRLYFPQKLSVSVNVKHRDLIARFGKSIGAAVLYATPRSNVKPIAFTVGEWRGLLMPLREHK